MKNLLFTLFFVAISLNLSGQRKMKVMSVEEIGIAASLSFNVLTEQCLLDGLEIGLTPISTNSLDTLFYEALQYNGLHQYQYYSESRDTYFLKKKKKAVAEENYNTISKGIQYLLDIDSISETEYVIFHEMLDTRYNPQLDNYSYSIEKINPFLINDQHLIVFQISIFNQSDRDIVVDNDFFLSTNANSYSSLTKEELIQYHGLLKNKEQIYYMKKLLDIYYLDRITVPAHQKINRYIAFNPIKYSLKGTEISSTNLKYRSKLNISGSYEIINNNPKFYGFELVMRYGNASLLNPEDAFFVTYSKAVQFLNNELFIEDSYLTENQQLSIIGLSRTGEFVFKRIRNIKGNDYLNFEKKRREKIELKLDMYRQIQKD